MFASKTVVAKLCFLTKRKKADLDRLWSAWRKMVKPHRSYKELRKEFPNIYSGYARNASFNSHSSNDPLIITQQDFRLVDAKKCLARWFVRIPISKGCCVWAPLKVSLQNNTLLAEVKVRDSKIVKRGPKYYFHFTVQKEVEFHAYHSVLSIDLGERFSATTVLWKEANMTAPKFYGKRIRGVRRHYAWLRRRLGNLKKFRKIKELSHVERRKVEDILHKISRAIVNEAAKEGAVIVMGDLKGIRQHLKNKGKRFNRIVGNMSYYKLSKMIEYKARWKGILVVYVNEAYTSKNCHICNNTGKRVNQGLFKCPHCGWRGNADYNGATNIGKRFIRTTLMNGVSGFTLLREAHQRPLKSTTDKLTEPNGIVLRNGFTFTIFATTDKTLCSLQLKGF